MVTILSKSRCVQCDMSKKLMEREGVEFEERRMDEDPAALELAKSLGYLQAPVLIAGDQHWSGFQPERIMALAA